MTATVSKRVGGWVLEWDPARPAGVWAVPTFLVAGGCRARSDRGVMVTYPDGVMAWDWPERTPAYVRRAAVSFLISCQQNHNHAERGNE